MLEKTNALYGIGTGWRYIQRVPTKQEESALGALAWLQEGERRRVEGMSPEYRKMTMRKILAEVVRYKQRGK